MLTSWLTRALIFCLTSVALLAAAKRDLARETEIESALALRAPAAVDDLRAARVAYDRDDFATAERLLRAVLERVPDYDVALRRLGASLARQGKRAEGLALTERAVALSRTPPNLATLAYFLAYPPTGTASKAERERALALLLECRGQPRGDDSDILFSTVQLLFQLDRRDQARPFVELLEKKAPEEPATHYFAAIFAAVDERWNLAVREARRAQALGLDEKVVREFLDSGISSRATAWWVGGLVGLLLAGWILGLVGLFALGIYLSRATLQQAETADVNQAVAPGEQRLRRLYRNVLNAAGVYYYISLPLVLLLVVGVGGAVIFLCLAAGFLPIKLLVLVVIGVLATVWTMGRSLFLRVNSTDPGRSLTRAEAEGLWQLTDEVAHTMNTRPIDEIRLTVGTDLAVYERGTWREKLENRAQRILILGTAVLDGFKQDDFRSVLAHEYGHFANRDTAGGDIALRVQNDMLKFYFTMRDAGQATWLNVAFHFLRVYNFIFRRISHGATRLQEILADRVAAQAYGPAAFEGGLRHVIARSIAFGAHADREIEAALKASRPLQNLYEATASDATSVREEYEKAINRPTTPDDTHPGPLDRFRLIARIPAPARPPVEGLVWDLFRDRAAIIQEMMATVEANIAPHRSTT